LSGLLATVVHVTVRPDTHRASTLARRQAVLRAAVDVVAERGVGGATHREIATRAGVSLSTTSYFFASIDELVLEALRFFVGETVARLDALAGALAAQELTVDQAIELFAGALSAVPEREVVAQFEAYLEVSRRPDVRTEVQAAMAAFERLAEAALSAAGVDRAAEAAPAFLALVDGFALQRIVRGDAPLRDGLRTLLAAYQAA
jgi:DNA-binding transcriptional regulator YbjK